MTVSGTPGTAPSDDRGRPRLVTGPSPGLRRQRHGPMLITDGSREWEVARNRTYTNSGTTLARHIGSPAGTGSAISLTSAASRVGRDPAFGGQGQPHRGAAAGPDAGRPADAGVRRAGQHQATRRPRRPFICTPYVPQHHQPGRQRLGPCDVLRKPASLHAHERTVLRRVRLPVGGRAALGRWPGPTWITTRATAVTLQDGRYCKSGDKTRLLLPHALHRQHHDHRDSLAKRYLCNVYNRVPRRLVPDRKLSRIHGPAPNTVRQANANSWNQVEIVASPTDHLMSLEMLCCVDSSNNGVHRRSKIQQRHTAQTQSALRPWGHQCFGVAHGARRKFPPVGRHYYAWQSAPTDPAISATFAATSSGVRIAANGSIRTSIITICRR